MDRIEEILGYWFGADPDDPAVAHQQVQSWFTANPDTDRYIRDHFEDDVKQASTGAFPQGPCGLATTGQDSRVKSGLSGSLALISVLDNYAVDRK